MHAAEYVPSDTDWLASTWQAGALTSMLSAANQSGGASGPLPPTTSTAIPLDMLERVGKAVSARDLECDMHEHVVKLMKKRDRGFVGGLRKLRSALSDGGENEIIGVLHAIHSLCVCQTHT